MLTNNQIAEKFHIIYKKLLSYKDHAVSQQHSNSILNDYVDNSIYLVHKSQIPNELRDTFSWSLNNLREYNKKITTGTDDTINATIKNCIYIGSYFTGNISRSVLSINSSVSDPRDEAYQLLSKKFNLVGKIYIYSIQIEQTANKAVAVVYFKVIRNNDTEFIDTNRRLNNYHWILMGNVGIYRSALTPHTNDIMARFLVDTNNLFVGEKDNGASTYNMRIMATKYKLHNIDNMLYKKISSTNDNQHYFNHNELITLLDTLIQHFSMPKQFMKSNFALILAVLNWCRKTSYDNKEYKSFNVIKNFVNNGLSQYKETKKNVNETKSVGSDDVILEPNRGRFLTVTTNYLHLLSAHIIKPLFKDDYVITYQLIKKLKLAKGGFNLKKGDYNTIKLNYYELRVLLGSFIIIRNHHVQTSTNTEYNSQIEISYIRYFIKACYKTINPYDIKNKKLLKELGRIYGLDL